MHSFFINDAGRLRSGWRLLIYTFPFLFLTTVWEIVVRQLRDLTTALGWQIPRRDFVFQSTFRTGLLVIAIGLGYVCAKALEELPWRSLGLTFHKGWLRDLVIGFAVGWGSLVLAVAIASRGLSFSFNPDGFRPVVISLIGSLVLLFVAALAEEAMFRGYAMQTLTRAKLAWLAILLTSVPFGLAHLLNPNVVPGVTFANTVIAGVWFAVAYLRTRSLWLPLGAHWSWNWALGWLFGLPVSGTDIVSHPLLIGVDKGPKWLTGGSYGIEGGVAGMIALILGTVFLWRTSLVSATPELLKMTSEENPVTTEPVISIRSTDNQT